MTNEVRNFESNNHIGAQINNKNKSLRLTERDIQYITWIAEQQAVRLDTLQLLFGGKRNESSNTPILAPKSAGKISLFSIKVIMKEKPEKNVAAEAVKKKALNVAF